MGVSEEQAALREDLDDNDHGFPELHLQLTRARTQDWKTRLTEYYNWLAIRSLDKLRHFEHDFSCSAYPKDSADDNTQLRTFKAWRRRETLASHRAKRVGTEFHGFLSLPAEIRELIYEQALIKGKVLLPRLEASPVTGSRLFKLRHEDVYSLPYNQVRRRYENTAKPIPRSLDYWPPQPSPIGLLCGISKLIHAEATRVFLSKNQFIFPQGSYDPLICFGKSYERAVLQSQWLRDVSFAFAYGDYKQKMVCIHAYHQIPSTSTPALVGESTNSTDRPYDIAQAQETWRQRIAEIKNLNLSRLQLSFADCICIYTRERKVAWVLDELMRDWDGSKPKVLEILDWEDDDEKAMIAEKLHSFVEGTEAGPVLVRFEGISGKERWRTRGGWLADPPYNVLNDHFNVLQDFDFDTFLTDGDQPVDTPAHDTVN